MAVPAIGWYAQMRSDEELAAIRRLDEQELEDSRRLESDCKLRFRAAFSCASLLITVCCCATIMGMYPYTTAYMFAAILLSSNALVTSAAVSSSIIVSVFWWFTYMPPIIYNVTAFVRIEEPVKEPWIILAFANLFSTVYAINLYNINWQMRLRYGPDSTLGQAGTDPDDARTPLLSGQCIPTRAHQDKQQPISGRPQGQTT